MAERNQRRSVSLADVAREAGVSAQTVSRVVHGSSAVQPRTAERVREAMERLGYRPSFAARSLRAGRYRAVGLAMFSGITGTANMYRLDGIARAATEAGHVLTLVELGSEKRPTLSGAAEAMGALPVDGLIFNLTRRVADFEAYRAPAGLPTVIVTPFAHPTCPTVGNDERGCSRTVVGRLLALGHETVFHVAGASGSVAADERLEGWREALGEEGVDVPEAIRGDWTGASGYEAGSRLAREPGCTAVYVSNDAMALGVVEALRDAGRRVPEDVSVVGVDDSLSQVLPHDAIASVRFDNRAVGRRAFERVVAGAFDGEPEHVLVPGTLIERASIAPPS